MIAIASFIIAAFAGALGGNLLALSLTDLDLGLLRNSIAGAVGGICGGAILHALMPTLAVMSAGGIDVAVIAGQVVGGCAGGVVAMRLGGVVKHLMGAKARHSG
jgi:uncharacterized membrane protein YeaQ/YmgE (transglycosylase-associated protein family)